MSRVKTQATPQGRLAAWLVCLAATLTGAGATFAQDVVRIPMLIDQLAPGQVVAVPLFIRDLSGTLLGSDAASGFKIQSLAVTIEYLPADAITAIDIERAGITAGLTPLFETEVSMNNRHSWIVAFDEAAALVPLTLDPSLPGDQVAELRLTLAANLAANTSITVNLVAPTALGNQMGTYAETASNGLLTLEDGTLITVPVELIRFSVD